MIRDGKILRFAGRFVLWYGLLIFPWPGANDAYGSWTRWLGRTAFSWESSQWIVRFSALSPTDAPPLDTRILLGNRHLLAADGTGNASAMDMDLRGIGWVPAALLSALVLATPLPWRRRLGALVAGLAVIHVYVLAVIGLNLWQGAAANSGLQLVSLSPFGMTVIDGLRETIVVQMGTGFVVAVLVWLLVTLRRTEWLMGEMGGSW